MLQHGENLDLFNALINIAETMPQSIKTRRRSKEWQRHILNMMLETNTSATTKRRNALPWRNVKKALDVLDPKGNIRNAAKNEWYEILR